jgi:hypothetical protein
MLLLRVNGLTRIAVPGQEFNAPAPFTLAAAQAVAVHVQSFWDHKASSVDTQTLVSHFTMSFARPLFLFLYTTFRNWRAEDSVQSMRAVVHLWLTWLLPGSVSKEACKGNETGEPVLPDTSKDLPEYAYSRAGAGATQISFLRQNFALYNYLLFVFVECVGRQIKLHVERVNSKFVGMLVQQRKDPKKEFKDTQLQTWRNEALQAANQWIALLCFVLGALDLKGDSKKILKSQLEQCEKAMTGQGLHRDFSTVCVSVCVCVVVCCVLYTCLFRYAYIHMHAVRLSQGRMAICYACLCHALRTCRLSVSFLRPPQRTRASCLSSFKKPSPSSCLHFIHS